MKDIRQKWLTIVLAAFMSVVGIWSCAQTSDPSEIQNPSVTDNENTGDNSNDNDNDKGDTDADVGTTKDADPDTETYYRSSYGKRPFRATPR